MARLFGRGAAGNRSNQDGSLATFTSGVSGDITSPATLLANYPDIYELGRPGVQYATDIVGTSGMPYVITVPSGKYWRLIGAVVEADTSAGATSNQTLTLQTRDSGDTEIESITLDADLDASETNRYTVLFGTDDHVSGNTGVAAQGTLTMDTKPTADDTIVLNGTTFTWVAALTGAANELLIGADLDASKAALEAAFKDRDNGGTLHSVTDSVYEALEMTMAAFATDDAVFTANVKGTAGNSLATTETFTAGSNVFDAATLGTTTAGVDQADSLSTLNYPTAGVYLQPGEDVVLATDSEDASDDFDIYLFYVEFDADPNP